MQKKTFKTITLSFLMKGHTHEDIDFVFALLAMFLLRRAFDSVEHLLRVLREFAHTMPLGSMAKTRTTCEKLDTVSDWKAWHHQSKIGCEITGIFGPDASHFFYSS